MDIVLPRLTKILSVWELLLAKVVVIQPNSNTHMNEHMNVGLCPGTSQGLRLSPRV